MDSNLSLNNLASLLRRSWNNEQLNVCDYDVADLVPIGENFGSHMIRVRAKVQHNKNSVIKDHEFVAKTILPTNCLINWTRLFEKELFMYTTIVPFYREMEIESKTHEDEKICELFPTLCGYRMSLTPNSKIADEDAVILFQDLRVEGFRTMDRKIGLDMDHAEMALKALAKFHAFGVVAKLKYPSKFEKLRLESQKPGFGCDGMGEICVKLIDLMRVDDRLSRFVNKFEKLVDLNSKNSEPQLLKHNVWSSIIHYDFWTSNIMFHHDEAGNVNGVKLIDFQTYTYANVSADLVYFLCTSLCKELMVTNFNHFVDTYHKTLRHSLETFQVYSDIFSKREFVNRLKNDAALELVHCVFSLYFFTAELEDFNDEQKKDILTTIMNSQANDLFLDKLLTLFEVYEREDWFGE
ncbi:hypothetical protein QAD02_011575 [Eretmocerus hayati]|uniref:Uncharacterized protein n=1 Tax=Eretmocerus hayati TaxID=131215 RepID=A0ACC2NWY6_9HYME|nr:hypothetical protein QAD02_011575 [Eretmocerus hayati]